ncbi:MAG: SDR family oxidoreductase [Proteobacteria bacterium]|jgi:NAD(P)-dependent dehydrogenase (short-subunit alcohol dehydrogenase family)|nr:SDR family oxidoreductase [Pseudomonadota bacterium]
MPWTADDIRDLSEKIAVVTGANSGIGYEAAVVLAQKGAKVILACRNQQKGQEALDKLNATKPKGHALLMALDLSSLTSIEEFSAKMLAEYEHLDLLINNAGVMMTPYQKTSDGFELQFGTNHLGHFALTGRLLPLLTAKPAARVVNVSSIGHIMGSINFDDLQSEKKYNSTTAYAQSKLANLLFTLELQRRFEEAGASAIAVAAHPGWSATNLQQNVSILAFLNHVVAQSTEMGALPTLRAAIDPEAAGGDYYGPKFAAWRGWPIKVGRSKKAKDADSAARLWQVSQELTGIEY